MKRYVFWGILALPVFFGGCVVRAILETTSEVVSTATSANFWRYGICDTAYVKFTSNSPIGFAIEAPWTLERWVLPTAGSTFTLRVPYPVSRKTSESFSVSVISWPPNPRVRSTKVEWTLSRSGRFDARTNGKYVSVVVELKNPNLNAPTNALIAKSSQ